MILLGPRERLGYLHLQHKTIASGMLTYTEANIFVSFQLVEIATGI